MLEWSLMNLVGLSRTREALCTSTLVLHFGGKRFVSRTLDLNSTGYCQTVDI